MAASRSWVDGACEVLDRKLGTTLALEVLNELEAVPRLNKSGRDTIAALKGGLRADRVQRVQTGEEAT